MLEDAEGRTFRSGSNFMSEETLSSIFEASVPVLNEDFDQSSPLAPSNWDYYGKAGLLGYDEVKDVASRISRFNEENPEIAFDDDLVEQYMFGVGSHHAGMLPAHKSFVELLYRNQLMKVVFATETLAAGINMPARTTVVCALAKRGDGSSMNLLETSNLLQMAGRAGRRGMDTDGTCVIVATPFEGEDDASSILTDPVKPISSQFSPSYALAVNLIDRGEGKLDVAKQLVGKSFAMWQRRELQENVESAIETHGDGVSEVLQTSAQERFMSTLIEGLESLVSRRSALIDVARVESLLPILVDREILKRTSKSFVGAASRLEQEVSTLGLLTKEYDALVDMQSLAGIEETLEEQEYIAEQIDVQRDRVVQTEKEISKHPFTSIARIVNDVMAGNSTEGESMQASLRSAREGTDVSFSAPLSADELSVYSKSAVVVRRKARKLASQNPDMDPQELIEQAREADEASFGGVDSWQDMLSITKTLVAYGCVSTETGDYQSTKDIESQQLQVSPAGMNVGMLGFENSLWALVAMGGAWDVVGASAKLDAFRKAMQGVDDDFYDNAMDESTADKPVPQQEAEDLSRLLQSLSPPELAGYVSSIISEGSRGSGGPSVLDQFQKCTPAQQRVVRSSLLALERLQEVQKENNVDEKSCSCTLYVND